jgi:predicted DCC family thiol-disulfide oxidoreductase YuxK
MVYTVIYDGNCNLCSNLVQLLAQFDRGQRFQYLPMQDTAALAQYQITPADCELGMIVIDQADRTKRWQGSAAAEQIGQLLPMVSGLVAAYRALPGFKPLGDRVYEQVRDHRYDWFGRRSQTYEADYAAHVDAVRVDAANVCQAENLCETTMPWQDPAVIRQSQRLIRSFQHWTGRSLLPENELTHDPELSAAALFGAKFVVVSHGTEADPIFNYGNQTALDLWEFDWAAFTQLPSRLSAEPVAQAERDRLLAQAQTQGYISDYRGVRIARSGQRFMIESVLLWTVLDEQGAPCGQAAMFANWQTLPKFSAI